jgi:hypothetical protein
VATRGRGAPKAESKIETKATGKREVGEVEREGYAETIADITVSSYPARSDYEDASNLFASIYKFLPQASELAALLANPQVSDRARLVKLQEDLTHELQDVQHVQVPQMIRTTVASVVEQIGPRVKEALAGVGGASPTPPTSPAEPAGLDAMD